MNNGVLLHACMRTCNRFFNKTTTEDEQPCSNSVPAIMAPDFIPALSPTIDADGFENQELSVRDYNITDS